jgi:hypothetical protein
LPGGSARAESYRRGWAETETIGTKSAAGSEACINMHKFTTTDAAARANFEPCKHGQASLAEDLEHNGAGKTSSVLCASL